MVRRARLWTLAIVAVCGCLTVYGLMWIRACFYILEQPMSEWTREDCHYAHREKGKFCLLISQTNQLRTKVFFLFLHILNEIL